jgi:hypothetical protein
MGSGTQEPVLAPISPAGNKKEWPSFKKQETNIHPIPKPTETAQIASHFSKAQNQT